MRSTRQYDSLRHELKLIYEELRNLAGELNVPVWTASQSNKEGSEKDVVGLTNMGESYAKAQVADVVLTLSRKVFLLKVLSSLSLCFPLKLLLNNS